MSQEVRYIPGVFPHKATAGFPAYTYLASDNNFLSSPLHDTVRTPGLYIPIALNASPVGTEAWNILGFSITTRIAVAVQAADGSAFQFSGRLGQLWAGVTINADPYNTGGTVGNPQWLPAKFPSDLSTFTLVWDGASEPISTVHVGVSDTVDNFTLLARSFQLPFPLLVRPGTQLGFALILTPSTIDPACFVVIQDCNYSIIYNTQ